MDKQFLLENDYISPKTNALYDYQFSKALKNIPWSEWFDRSEPLRCRTEYLTFYKNWIESSELNSIIGLGNFSRYDLINGTTQTFDEAYFKYSNKRLRIFRGEYAYHKRIFLNYKFIEDGKIEGNDWVIISAPFCTTGDVHQDMYQVLLDCEKLDVPVIIDCAYFGTCYDFSLDLSSKSIESVSFSLTKGIGVGDIRSGIRFSNINDNNPISQQNNYEHAIHGAAKIGLYMMNKFSPDFIPKKYKDAQQEICNKINLQSTKCIHLALGDKSWNGFEIDGKYHRLGIRKLVKSYFNGELNV